MWRVIIPKRIKKVLEKFPINIREEILILGKKLEESAFPSGYDIKKVRGTTNCYRVRFGDCRIIYCIDKKEKTIIFTDAFRRERGYRV